jgi:aminomethyltransferase
MLTDLQSGAPESTTNLRANESANDAGLLVEFRALTTACAAYSLNDRLKLMLTGEDRTRWLNGMVTNNVRDLSAGQGLYAFLLNPQGRIQGDLYAFNRGTDIVLDVDRAQLEKLLAIFDHYIIMDDVLVTEASDKFTAFGVQGPNAREVLQSVGLDVPELGPLQLIETKWQGIEVTLVRAEAWKRDAYEIWISPKHFPALVDALLHAGALEVGVSAQRLYRIASGIPVYGEDIRERDLPQETGQERALHYAKGCYVGQEIVERIRSRGQIHRLFSGFELTTPCPAGSKISTEGAGTGAKEVGEITSVADVPTLESRIIALGYLRREALTQPLKVDGSSVTIHTLPFEDILQGKLETIPQN